MLRLCTFTALALVSLSSLAEAAALPKPLHNLVQAELRGVSAPQRRLTATSCTDFSGHWAGTCRVKDKSENVSFVVTQKGCDSISFDNDALEMGHAKVESDSSVLATGTVLANTRFSADGQTAEAIATLNVDSPFLPDSVSGRLAGEMHKAGDALQINGQIDLWLGLKSLASLPAECDLKAAN